jgi:hypothetical protein
MSNVDCRLWMMRLFSSFFSCRATRTLPLKRFISVVQNCKKASSSSLTTNERCSRTERDQRVKTNINMNAVDDIRLVDWLLNALSIHVNVFYDMKKESRLFVPCLVISNSNRPWTHRRQRTCLSHVSDGHRPCRFLSTFARINMCEQWMLPTMMRMYVRTATRSMSMERHVNVCNRRIVLRRHRMCVSHDDRPSTLTIDNANVDLSASINSSMPRTARERQMNKEWNSTIDKNQRA